MPGLLILISYGFTAWPPDPNAWPPDFQNLWLYSLASLFKCLCWGLKISLWLGILSSLSHNIYCYYLGLKNNKTEIVIQEKEKLLIENRYGQIIWFFENHMVFGWVIYDHMANLILIRSKSFSRADVCRYVDMLRVLPMQWWDLDWILFDTPSDCLWK